MNYQEEDKEDKKYKKGYGRKEFQKDVAEAVKPVVQETKTAKKKRKHPPGAAPTPRCPPPSSANSSARKRRRC